MPNKHGHAGDGTVLDEATKRLQQITAPYELLAQKSGMEVTVLEDHNRAAGRCLSLRTGDTLTEDVNSELFDLRPGETRGV